MTGTRQDGVTGALRGHDGNEGVQAVGAVLEAEVVSGASDTLDEGA